MSRPVQPCNGVSVISECRLLNLELAQKYGPKAWQAHIEGVTAAHKRSASAVPLYCRAVPSATAEQLEQPAAEPPSAVAALWQSSHA